MVTIFLHGIVSASFEERDKGRNCRRIIIITKNLYGEKGEIALFLEKKAVIEGIKNDNKSL